MKRSLSQLPDSIDVPKGGKAVVACCLPEGTWAFAAALPAAPPRKGKWEFTIEGVTLEVALEKYTAWLADKREKGDVAT